jgi:hypothetical protein
MKKREEKKDLLKGQASAIEYSKLLQLKNSDLTLKVLSAGLWNRYILPYNSRILNTQNCDFYKYE